MYFGPFQAIQKIIMVAYKLDLPSISHIYLVFHVSSLKEKLGACIEPQCHLPVLTLDGTLNLKPEKILLRRMKKKGNCVVTEVLTQWKGTL